MRAGDLIHKVKLKRKVATRDDKGGEVVTYPVAAVVSAKVEPIRGRQYEALQQAQSDIEMKVTIYYRADVQADWRVAWVRNGSEQDYEIIGQPIDVGGLKEWLELMARTSQSG